MKVLASLMSSLLFFQLSHAQLEGRQWPMASYASIVTFSSNTIVVDSLPVYVGGRESYASICNTSGELQFFSNGFKVFLPNGSLMPQLDSLQAGMLWPCCIAAGTPGAQNMLVLPKPNHPGQYVLFYNNVTNSTFLSQGWLHPDVLHYAVVDMNFYGPNQPCLWLTKQVAYQGNIGDNRLTACQHGNGRDWWIVIHGYDNNEYIRFLLSPDGVSQPEHQFIGPSFGEIDAGAFARFSPDGNHYATGIGGNPLLLMDFDRCTGLFSNPVSFSIALDTLVYQGDTVIAGGGLVGLDYSPSGRFLYINNIYTLSQYDLQAADVEASRQLIFWWNPSYNCQQLHAQQCAPDGKIYIATWDGGPPTRFHVINSPDSLGAACNFVPSSFYVPTSNATALPNLPRFGLGALTASGCDTLPPNAIATAEEETPIRLSPNPASTTVQIQIPASLIGSQLTITNTLGQTVFQQQLFSGSLQLATHNYPTGVYLVRVSNNKQQRATKLVKQ